VRFRLLRWPSLFFFSCRRRHTSFSRDWSSDVSLPIFSYTHRKFHTIDRVTSFDLFQNACFESGIGGCFVEVAFYALEKAVVLLRDRKSVVEGKSVGLGGRGDVSRENSSMSCP